MSQQMYSPAGKEPGSQTTLETAHFGAGQRPYWQALAGLVTRAQGELLLPGDADFEAARAVWNGTADHHPALIVRAVNAANGSAAITFAREQNLPLSVRRGGHSMVGFGTNDGGVVIDLSRMKAISIDPAQHIARIQAGLTWGEVAEALQPYGLALTSGDTATVGVGGLMLGGGIGWMARKYGLTIDHLRAVELVTADGALLRVSANEYADLFWGLRGGGNFGVATAFEVDLHPGGTVLGGAVFYDAAEAEEVLRAYARYAAAAPDELTTMALLMVAPPAPFIPVEKQGTPVVALAVCYTGDLAEGERVVAPLRRLAAPVADVIGPMPYPAIFELSAEGAVPGREHAMRSFFLPRLNDEVLRTLTRASLAVMSPELLVELRVLGGAMSRVASDATAFAHCEKEAMVLITNFGPGSAATPVRRARTEQFWQALAPYAEGVYVNFWAEDGAERIHEAYPPATYARLVALKNRYDPTNLFHHNQNIAPSL